MCDQNVTWSGWYRLFINNMSAQIPDKCVAQYSCGTDIPLWIRGGHPTVDDGVVARDVCGYSGSYCCFYGSYPIKVKACPGIYYVYELVTPTVCNAAYCAGSAAVAFMSYSTMENLLKPNFFNTPNDTIKTMMSTVISATLPKTTNTKLTEPVNFTLKHIREFDPNGSLSCVYWNISEWIVDGCSVLETNSSYTVCSCVHLSTFALIMQTSRPPESNSLLELLNLVCVIVGLVFFSLALLTFALCQWSPGVNNVARINICISLLLAHLLFLLTQQFLSVIRPQQVLCAVISGLLHFLFLSGFVWMFIEAVMLFICVKNLSQISSKKREVLSSGFMCVIGYLVALVVVCVSVGLVPEGYGSEQCWIKMDKGFIWSFLGPVCVILASNMILFIKIVICLNSTLKNLNAEVSQMKQTKIMVFKTLAQCVVLGCPWILGFFSNGSKMLEILFLILNSQQGTFIFLIYCVLNNEQ
ncbi:hypothetical protein Q8A67_005247 [Cirrhinus molitorella]|uniref:Uncharacterized protein n=1 Tax=Cirrhinus molitorella TaxID=172907 RepID=A0AA88Q1W3_9TELE|nr:hypothetical protein Q8A67_005247 [Cirrhinus molitorella]